MEPSEQSGPDSQDVNPEFLQQLRELDIPEDAAKQVRSLPVIIIVANGAFFSLLNLGKYNSHVRLKLGTSIIPML